MNPFTESADFRSLTAQATTGPKTEAMPANFIYYRGPGTGNGQVDWFTMKLSGSRMSNAMIQHQAAPEAAGAQLALSLRRLESGGQVYFDMHGGVRKEHMVWAGLHSKPLIPTTTLMSWALAEIGDRGAARPVFHFSACHAKALCNEVKPGSALWDAAYCIIYSSKRETSLAHYSASMSAALGYLDRCKERQLTPDPLKLFQLAGMRRGDCMTLLGGELKGPVSFHAPKSPADLKSDQRASGRLQASETDLALLADHALSPEDLSLLPSMEMAIADMMQARLARDDVEAVRSILESRPYLRDTIDNGGFSPLHSCAMIYSVKTARYLVSIGANVSVRDADGFTPLLLAVMNEADGEKIKKADEMVDLLLEAGADPNETDNSGRSTLIWAAEAKRAGAVAKLLKHKADPHYQHEGITPLAIARQNKDTRTIAMLFAAVATLRGRTIRDKE